MTAPHPVADAITTKAMVVMQDRPVVVFSQWLAEALRVCGESRRGLQVVTPVPSRLSLPLRLVLTGPNSRWVVQDNGTYYDGMTGRPLRWDGAAFSPVPEALDYAPAYLTRPAEPVGTQLSLTFRVRRAGDELLAGAVGQLCHSLTGQPPIGWGTAEPAMNLWSLDGMTRLFRQRSPRATWLAVVGGRPTSEQPRTAVGTMLFSAAQGGVEEAVTLVVGYPAADPPPVAALPTLIGAVAAEYRLTSLFAQMRPGRADLTMEPHWTGSAAPIGMAVGAEMGVASGPADISGQPIGDPRSPGIWFGLGDGRSPEGWQRYERLMRHLRPSA